MENRGKEIKRNRRNGRGRGRLSQETLQQLSSLSTFESHSISSTEPNPQNSPTSGVITAPTSSVITAPMSGVITASDTESTSISSDVNQGASTSSPSQSTSNNNDYIKKLMRRYGFELIFSDNSHHRFVVRPGKGRDGKPIGLLTNYYPLNLPRGEVFQYDVEIKMMDIRTHKRYRCESAKHKRKIMETLFAAESTFKGFRPAFDGMKNLYTRNPLPIQSEKTFQITINDEESQHNFEIKIKPVDKEDDFGNKIGNSISLEPLHQLFDREHHVITPEIINAVMAVETILRHIPALHLSAVGRSFFQKSERKDLLLGNCRQIWFGHHQSLKLTECGPMINIDRSATVFFKGSSVIDLMLDVLYLEGRDLRRIRGLNNQQIRDLKTELYNVTIKVTHLPYPRKHKIHDITNTSATETEFDTGNNETVMVADYFKSQYGALRYPNLPCLVSEKPPLKKGERNRRIYLPFEVCEIVEQHSNKILSKKHKKIMVERTARCPTERFREISSSLNTLNNNFRSFSAEFGININLSPLKVTGRVINPPAILYDRNVTANPQHGCWNLMEKRFLKGIQINRWALLNFSQECNMDKLQRFERILLTEGRKLGLNFNETHGFHDFSYINFEKASAGDFIKNAKDVCSGLQIAIIVIPDKFNIYSNIKSVAETELGLKTQCVKDVNVNKEMGSLLPIIRNICLKINTKLGGVNNSLFTESKRAILDNRVIIVGADCSHPSPGDEIKYSIAAVVGSLDEFPSRYKASIRAQLPVRIDNVNSGREIIVELKEMLIEIFQAYKNKNKTWPEKIIFYRDGVSEGDFNKVIDYELVKIKEACEELGMDNGIKTPITFVIVGKRHHTRFAPIRRSEGVGKCGNIPPGTTVDTGVIHPVFFDFFICSQFGIQGTSRPSHYTVLHDDNRFTADALQSLTYQMCYSYALCTKSISIPCAAKYADLAAYRAKVYLIDNKSNLSDYLKELPEIYHVPEPIKQTIKVVESMADSMYFV